MKDRAQSRKMGVGLRLPLPAAAITAANKAGAIEREKALAPALAECQSMVGSSDRG
jgi:hypothetical protein